MKKEDFLGVWKLMQYGEGKIITSQTHLVVKDDVLWEVDPGTVYYENKPGPEVKYSFEEGSAGQPAKVSTADGYKYLVAKNGDTLLMKLGPVYGYFPESFEDNGNLAEYKLELEAVAKTVGVLPKKIKVEQFEAGRLGTFRYDSNLNWWQGSIGFKGSKINLYVHADEDDKYAPFTNVITKLLQLEEMDFAEIATSDLLVLYNEEWRLEGDSELTSEEFKKLIQLDSVVLNNTGESTVWLNDADLFAGHQIRIVLDAENGVVEVTL